MLYYYSSHREKVEHVCFLVELKGESVFTNFQMCTRWTKGANRLYRGEPKGLYVLLSRTQAGPGGTIEQEREENSRNHVQAF